jgi:hypothetical protein
MIISTQKEKGNFKTGYPIFEQLCRDWIKQDNMEGYVGKGSCNRKPKYRMFLTTLITVMKV